MFIKEMQTEDLSLFTFCCCSDLLSVGVCAP
uniref:Uncharacterized protein n=1 Tax=Anguilla anguilla TaxID=7936 RepID=A0A0E9PFT7_ANGAN